MKNDRFFSKFLLLPLISLSLVSLKIYDVLWILSLVTIFFVSLSRIIYDAKGLEWEIISHFAIVFLWLLSYSFQQDNVFLLTDLMGVLKIIVIVSIYYFLRSQTLCIKFRFLFYCSFSIASFNTIINFAQLIFPNLYWGVYSSMLHYGDTAGVEDGLIGLFGSRTINAQILFILFSYYLYQRRTMIVFFHLVLILLTNIKMVSLLALLCLLYSLFYKYIKNLICSFRFVMLFFCVIFSIYFYNESDITVPYWFDFIESISISSSFLLRQETFYSYIDLVSYRDHSLWFGFSQHFADAVDSQWLLILVRHGVIVLIFISILSIIAVKNIAISLSIFIMGITSQVIYSPLILFIYLGFFVFWENKKIIHRKFQY